MSKGIETPLGILRFFVDGVEQDVNPVALPSATEIFIVDGRCGVFLQLNAENNTLPTVVEIILESNLPFTSGSYTDEGLALIAFDYEKTNVSVGFRGDDPEMKEEYLSDRIRATLSVNYANRKDMVCQIAWLTSENKYEKSSYSTLAADTELGSSSNKSMWPEGQNGVATTQQGWLNGTQLVDGTRIWDTGKVIGNNGETAVRVHMNKEGSIHGYPVNPHKYLSRVKK